MGGFCIRASGQRSTIQLKHHPEHAKVNQSKDEIPRRLIASSAFNCVPTLGAELAEIPPSKPVPLRQTVRSTCVMRPQCYRPVETQASRFVSENGPDTGISFV
jgi:hypothetical protein